MAHVARRHSPVVDVTAIVTVFCPMGEDPLSGGCAWPFLLPLVFATWH